MVLIYTQTARIDLPLLIQNAKRFFEGTVYVLEERGLVYESSAKPGNPVYARLRIANPKHHQPHFAGVFKVTCRPSNEDDKKAALSAASPRDNGNNLGSAASRCALVWEVEPESPPGSKRALLSLSALLAQVAFAPVLSEGEIFDAHGASDRAKACPA